MIKGGFGNEFRNGMKSPRYSPAGLTDLRRNRLKKTGGGFIETAGAYRQRTQTGGFTKTGERFDEWAKLELEEAHHGAEGITAGTGAPAPVGLPGHAPDPGAEVV